MRAGRFSAAGVGVGAVFFVVFLIGGLASPPRAARGAVIFSVTYPNNRINTQNADTGVVTNFFTPPAPAQGGGGVGLAASTTELFYSTIDNVNIYRLNPTTGAVLGFFARPAAATSGIDALGFGASSFGPALFAQDYTANTMYLLNPTTGVVFTSYAIPYDALGGIDFDNTTNQLWTSDSAGVIRATNPNTGATISSFPTGVVQHGIGLVDGRLFTVAGGAATIVERNKTTGATINSFATPNNLAAGALAGIPAPSAVALLSLFAPATSLSRRRHGRRHGHRRR